MNILVTGGAGFIGGHLIDRLLLEGHRVRVLDLFRDGVAVHRIHGRLDRRLKLIPFDITKAAASASHFRRVDWVFHLAGRSGIAESIANPREFYDVNVTGTMHMLEAARAAGVKKFIYASSASCYGNAPVFPTPEDAPVQLDHPYALTKYLGEQYCLHWWQVYKVPVTILRLFSVYGPKVRKSGNWGPIVSLFMNQKEKGLPLTVAGNGLQSRDFVYIDDVVNAFLTAARRSISGIVLNVGSGKATTIEKFALLIGSRVTYGPGRPEEISRTQADIGKIRRILGWRPKVSIEEGIERVRAAETMR